MKTTVFKVITYYIITGLLPVATAQESVWLRTEIEKIIRFDTEINFNKVPGFIIGIIDKDSTYVFAFGQRTLGKKSVSIQETDVYEIGSVTKLYTAQIIQSLVSENKISLQDKLNHYLPIEYQNPRLEHLTLYDLLNHQSGLPLRPDGFGSRERDSQNPYLYYSKKDLLSFYRDYIPEKDGFVYSHTNYALLELVIEVVSGLDFNDAFERYISEPLNLASTFVDFPEQKENLISPGYDKASEKVKPWIYSTFRASEGVKTTVEDGLDFLKFLVSTPGDLKEEVSVPLPSMNKSEASFNSHLFIENGWHIVPIKHKRVGIHTGRTSGHHCFMGMVKDSGTAVIVLSNSWLGTGDLGLQILRLINQNWKDE